VGLSSLSPSVKRLSIQCGITFYVLSKDLPWQSEKNDEKLHSVYQWSRPRFGKGISRIQAQDLGRYIRYTGLTEPKAVSSVFLFDIPTTQRV
jgi:hypothetical protein